MGEHIYPGKCILLPKPNQPTRHLWIVLTEADKNSLEVVFVNLTTHRHDSDDTVILDKGDHEFIKHRTVVYFADTRFAPVNKLKEIAKQDEYNFHKDCSTEMLKRIQCGLLISKFTPKKFKQYCKPVFSFC
ncbi:hypothetical protein [Chlorogloea sp. CCALA 695]|uniref:hypothetical protein n=1 Tax=Chlorogloea sp. CCALA 695 TaxID=2107693 RepID=UPI000D06916D|nr:hypothetical protein [Chlorogloea sp. CCALA 695]PSB27617.1 hypothetical protein C7B70_22080 [Chlorogloea sp. CCALA 695]